MDIRIDNKQSSVSFTHWQKSRLISKNLFSSNIDPNIQTSRYSITFFKDKHCHNSIKQGPNSHSIIRDASYGIIIQYH